MIATDMFGGTPSNLAISVMDDSNVEVIAGVNLPLLVKFASIRTEATLLEALAHRERVEALSGCPQVGQDTAGFPLLGGQVLRLAFDVIELSFCPVEHLGIYVLRFRECAWVALLEFRQGTFRFHNSCGFPVQVALKVLKSIFYGSIA